MTDEPISEEQLHRRVEANEALLQEKKSITEDVKDRFAVPKSAGYDIPAVKTVIKRRAHARQAVEELDAKVQTYEEALN